MKAVLLAAGRGQRLRPITNSIPKPMMPIAGKPFLEYVIDDITNIGFDDICIVIGHHGNQIKDYFGDGRKFNVQIQYVIQKEFKGTADATNCAKEFVNEDKFLLYLSDTIIPNIDLCLKNMLKNDSEIDILSAKIPHDEITSAGAIELNDGYVQKISEKPSQTSSNLVWAGVALFKSNFIFKIIENLESSFTGEYEITEAMNLAITHNKKIRNHLCDRYIDSGTVDGLIEATKFILGQKYTQSSHSYAKSDVVLVEPFYIGKNCLIGNNVEIGPFASIGNNVKIGDNVKLKEAIILDGANVLPNQNIYKTIRSKEN